MTDKTDLIREIHEYVTAHGGENTATHLLVQAASAIQTQAAELEAVGAGGVSGPLMGQPQAMPDLSALTERGAKAWAGVDAQALRDGTYQQAAPKAAPVVWLSSKQLRGVTALHGQYLPFRCQPEGRFDTPVYLVEAAPKAAPGEPFDECFPGEPRVAVPQGLIGAACFAISNKRDGGKVLEQLRRYSVGDLSQPLAPQQKAHHLTQALTDQENQPNQYGVEFGMSGQQMHFKIGNQLFRLAYEPDDQQEFEFMKRMLIHAFSTFTPDVKAAPQQEAQEPSRAAKTWCSYVAGMIGCYLNEPDESTKVQAIAGIIERRLWALPTPQPAPDCHHRPPCNECAALAAKERQP